MAYQSVMDTITATGVHLPENVQDLQSLLQIAQAAAAKAGVDMNGESKLESDMMQNVGQRKTFDPNSVVESVRQGVRLDLGLTRLRPEEVKVITVVLSGRLSVDQVAPLVRSALQQGFGLKGVASQFTLDSEKRHSRQHSGRSHSVGSASELVQNGIPREKPVCTPPPISVVNLSYTYIGNSGIELLSEILYKDNSCLKTLDISFCNIEEKGLLCLARALSRRKRKRIPALKGVILSGNYMVPRAAAEIGAALSPSDRKPNKRSRKGSSALKTGYETDSTESDADDDDEDFGISRKRKTQAAVENSEPRIEEGLHVLHVANASMTAEATSRLLEGLGTHCTIRELNLY